MNREFLDFYNRELSLLYEQAGEFAEQYPGIAERLGGLIRERSRPHDCRPVGGRGIPCRPSAT